MIRSIRLGHIHLDVLLARHEDENISCHAAEVDLQGLLHCSFHVILLRSLHTHTQFQNLFSDTEKHHQKRAAHHTSYFTEQDVHWERPSWNVENGNVSEESRKFVRVHGGRCDDELQIGASGHHLSKR